MKKSGFPRVLIIFFIALTLQIPFLLNAHAAEETIATITLIEGDGAKLKMPGDSSWKEAREDMELPTDTTIRTDTESRVELQFLDNSIVRINSFTHITLSMPDTNSKHIKAEKGQVWLHLKKMPSGGVFEIQTPAVTCGVRGTSFWVDIDEKEGDSVSVEDGEVEVRRGERRLKRKKKMMTRMRQGRLEDPSQFDPEKRARWEKWTEKHVKERFEKLQQEIGQYRTKAKSVATDAQNIIKEAASLAGDLKKAVATVVKAVRKVDRLEKQTSQLKENLSKNFKGSKNRPNKRKAQQLKKKVEQLLKLADSTVEDFESAKKQFSEFRDNAKDLFERSNKLKEEFVELKKRSKAFQARIKKQQEQREFDPQWPKLKKVFDTISEHENKIMDHAEQIDGALTGRALHAKEKAQNLISIIEKTMQGIEEHQEEIAAKVKTLAKMRAELEIILEKINRKEFPYACVGVEHSSLPRGEGLGLGQ